MYWPLKLPCVQSLGKEIVVTLKDFQMILICLFIALFVSLLAFIFENGLHFVLRRKNSSHRFFYHDTSNKFMK